MTDSGGDYGVSLINDAKYGYDVLKQGEGDNAYVRTRLTVLRSTSTLDLQTSNMTAYEVNKFQPSRRLTD